MRAFLLCMAVFALLASGCIGQEGEGKPFGGNPAGAQNPQAQPNDASQQQASGTGAGASGAQQNGGAGAQQAGEYGQPSQPAQWQPPNGGAGNMQMPSGGQPMPPVQWQPQNGNLPQPLPGQQNFAAGGMQPGGAQAPRVNANAPLPGQPQGAPEGRWMDAKIGSVQARYFSTAVARGMMESGTDYFITLNNTGGTAAKICAPACCSELRANAPEWNLHFFALQDFPITLAPGETRKLWYFASLDRTGFFNQTFRFWECGNEAVAASLKVAFGATDERFWGNETSYIEGTVKDAEGRPVEGANVVAATGCGRQDFKGTSGADGKYAIPVLGMEDVEAIYLGRDLACTTKEYWIAVDKEGYEYYYRAGIAPTRAAPAAADIVLEKRAESADYALEWESKVQDNYGFFWVKPSEDWSVFAAAQAKHPPELGKPANFYLFNASGAVVWKQPTGNECWGIDIAKDGGKVVAGCHDGYVYMADRQGRLLWKYDEKAMVRSACLSPDGSMALSGITGTLHLFDAATGAKTDVARSGDWLRNCVFYQDGSGFVAGSRETGGFDAAGAQQWQQVIGEFPLFMGVDADGNTYASGKSRTLFSFARDGSLRWSHKISEPTITAGQVAQGAGRIAAGSVGGSVYLFGANGTLLWQRGVLGLGEPSAVGHNAVAISQDGSMVVAGTDSNCVVAYDARGTLLWKDCAAPDESNPDLKMGVTNVQVSPDKSRIIASYGDNRLRMFRRAG